MIKEAITATSDRVECPQREQAAQSLDSFPLQSQANSNLTICTRGGEVLKDACFKEWLNGSNGGEGEDDATLGCKRFRRTDLLQNRKAGEIGDAHNVFVTNSERSLGMILVFSIVDAHVVIDCSLLFNHITSDLRESDGILFSSRHLLVTSCTVRVCGERGEERALWMIGVHQREPSQ